MDSERGGPITPWLAGAGVAALVVMSSVVTAVPRWLFTCGVLIVLVAAIASRAMDSRRLHASPLAIACCVFVLAQLVSTLFSVDRGMSAAGLVPLSIGVLLLFATRHAASHAPSARVIVGALAAAPLIISCDVLVQRVVGHSPFSGEAPMGGRYQGSLPHPNDFALAAACLPFLLCVFARARLMPRVIGMLVVAALVLAAALLTQSRTAMGGAVLSMLVIAAVLLPSRARWIVPLFVVVVCATAWALDAAGFRDRVLDTITARSEGRLGIWLVAWRMFIEAPILGQGPHTFGLFYPRYLAVVHLPEGYEPLVGYIPWAHNVYLEFLAERGVVGFAALAALVYFLLARAWSGVFRRDDAPDPIDLGVLASVGALLAMACLDLSAQKDWCVFIVCVLIGLVMRDTDATRRPAELVQQTPEQPTARASAAPG